MNQCIQEQSFFRNRKARRERMLHKLANMRAAKSRKRLENPPEREPKYEYERYYPLEFGVRNKATGETWFVDLKSVRHAAKALGLVLKYYS